MNKVMKKLIAETMMTEQESNRYQSHGEPMHWRDGSDARKTELANDLSTYGITGATEDTEIREAMEGMTLKDAESVAAELIGVNNYSEFNPVDNADSWAQTTRDLYQRITEEYDGIDAYVYMAQAELAGQIMGSGASDERLVAIMTEALSR